VHGRQIVHLLPPGKSRKLPDEEEFLGMEGLVRWIHFVGHGEAESGAIAHAALLIQEGVDDNGTWRPDRLTSTDVEGARDLWPRTATDGQWWSSMPARLAVPGTS